MKFFSLILSVITFTTTLYFLISQFPDLETFDGFLYFVLLLLLMLICITGIIINRPVITRVHNKFKTKL
ncbi:hypothetical protein Q766_01545 [Flavobacterium subsaxonicum WB 4.1-42 = DSM 21790]|uniref:Uncharacterized protein n=1 Tax=Flavobacterium subsaxonicum WB 4.1-42 = DSM 21790 TaxID=1121898 RepID=A0A0A2MTA2_9FLAO|nr:hypothetical protein Q766_01545 [Flavobacterium subsaxonicum WB 4.1-42 = DSM 21790]